MNGKLVVLAVTNGSPSTSSNLSNGISMFRERPLHFATSLCHYMPGKPHSTSMLDLVVLTCFDKDTLEYDELRVSQFEHCFHQLRNLPRTGARHGFPWLQWFSLVFNGFPDDGIAVPLGPLWFLAS